MEVAWKLITMFCERYLYEEGTLSGSSLYQCDWISKTYMTAHCWMSTTWGLWRVSSTIMIVIKMRYEQLE